MEHKYIIHTDGGARGNPGPAAIGVVIEGPLTGKKTYQEYIGKKTNNEAEYQALIFALKKLKQLVGMQKLAGSTIECHADSELMVKQLNGEFKIKDADIREFFIQIWNLKIDLGVPVSFLHVPRDRNAEADKLVNHVLDREESKLAI